MSPKLVCGGGGGATLLSPVTPIVVVTVEVPGGTTAVLAATEAMTDIPTRNGWPGLTVPGLTVTPSTSAAAGRIATTAVAVRCTSPASAVTARVNTLFDWIVWLRVTGTVTVCPGASVTDV